MNEIAKVAKREFLYIKALEIGFIVFLITLVILSINALIIPPFVPMSITVPPYIPVFEIITSLTGLICATMLWRWYHIPPQIQTNLHSYFADLEYSTKRRLFHVVKVEKSKNLYFKIKIQLYKHASGESCLFHLESMPLLPAQQDPERFKLIAEQFFLRPNFARQTFSTSCELEEVHLRSLFMTQALEQYLN